MQETPTTSVNLHSFACDGDLSQHLTFSLGTIPEGAGEEAGEIHTWTVTLPLKTTP